ncbi:bucentaur or craniofacial development-domain-containing protein [Lipomyces japonicus]|uniref:bucentaur or craniofacial development-domain-containing protein n=1 Tax=Lipomyces japonicus TaxID=56871 RepID=UPI0034CE1B9B
MSDYIDTTSAPLDKDEEEYHESEDEDFDPHAVADGLSLSDEDEEDEDNQGDVDNEGIVLVKNKLKRDNQTGDPNDNKRIKSNDNHDDQVDGIKILTRAQRIAEEADKKHAKATKSNIDADAIWKSLKESGSSTKAHEDDYATITETYEFAKQVMTREKRVKKNSPEAQEFFKRQTQSKVTTATTATTAIGQPPKRPGPPPRRRKPSSLDAMANKGKPTKINTLEKSKMDWQDFVQNEGIEDDLKRHNKGGYLLKQDFLQRVDEKRYMDLKEGQKAAKK